MFARHPPTDFALLREIHKRHEDDFRQRANDRSSKILVPIDIPGIADHFGSDQHSIFGRLYYHLDREYGEPPPTAGGPRKVFFTPVAGADVNCVNFPLLEAVLAGLWEQRRRDRLAVWTALFSLGIALSALLVSIFG